MSAKLLTEHNLEFLRLKGCCTCSSESTPVNVKMPHCWKSRVMAQMLFLVCYRPTRSYCYKGFGNNLIGAERSRSKSGDSGGQQQQ